jgi:hypothetical protein
MINSMKIESEKKIEYKELITNTEGAKKIDK